MSEILKEKGNEAFKLQKYAESEKLYKDAITLDPQNPVLYSNRAMALIKLSNWEECIETCDGGLRQHPDKKTKVKLLWRRGTGYSKLKDFKNSRESYSEALKLDENNTSVLRSMEELNSQESQFKRSHSIDQFEADKRTKTTQFEKIPIYEVDALPVEFTSQKTTTSKNTQSGTHPLPSATNTPLSATSVRASPSLSLTKDFPEVPTIYQLTSIIKANRENPYAYKYIFGIECSVYKQLLRGGNVDPAMLNFLLDSILYTLSNEPSAANISKASELLGSFASAPRFGLVKGFIDTSKLSSLNTKFGEKLDNALYDWLS